MFLSTIKQINKTDISNLSYYATLVWFASVALFNHLTINDVISWFRFLLRLVKLTISETVSDCVRDAKKKNFVKKTKIQQRKTETVTEKFSFQVDDERIFPVTELQFSWKF